MTAAVVNVVLVFLPILLVSTPASSLSSPMEDIRALAKLKASLIGVGVGGNGTALADWDSAAESPAHCRFSGVTCDANDSRVISLDLTGVSLPGTLPPDVGLLDRLVNVSFAATGISGAIPEELARLSSLRFLNISNNNLTGGFPDAAGDGGYFPALEVLDAYNNNLNGPLPEGLVEAPRLRYLHLGGNFFSGEIPAVYGGIAGLEYLGLDGNNLTGRVPASLARLRNLTWLYIGYFSQYSGGIPPEFGELSSLAVLDMASCGLSGAIPPELGQLKNLNTLFLQMNRLSGEIPPELGSLPLLDSLDLSINELAGEIPASFAGLHKLKLLNLFRNHLRGSIPESIADLPLLEVLQVWENNLTGELPAKLGSAGRLTKFDVTMNHLTGLVPRGLCAGGRLELLVLMDNRFFGRIPEELGACKTLRRVRLSNNFLNGSVPPGLFDLPDAEIIELSENFLSGELPAVMAGGNLSMLLLDSNWISGGIPPAIGNLPALQTLDLSFNRLSGAIPPEVGRLRQLSKLNLSGNQISGGIPQELISCYSLAALDLSSNAMNGEIPPDIAELKILNTLNLSRNHITGEIPRDMVKMMSLTTLDLSFNNLSGAVPVVGQFLVFNGTSFAGNPGLCSASTNSSPDSCLLVFTPTSARTKSAGTGWFYDPKNFLLWLGVISGFLLLLFFGVQRACRLCHQASRRRSGSWRMTAFQKLDFTATDVVEWMKEDNIIGKGGAGIVYRGTTNGGDEIAIKRLVSHGIGGKHDRGFMAEVTTLGRIRHRNIVRLLGFVSNREANLLLYEYMPNGSLGEMLHGTKGAHLGWDARCRIAAEAACGLCYLHHDCSPRILHRDVKSNNILLDSAFEAHVADFGLAKFLGGSGGGATGPASECMSAIAGSYGYIAPEYAFTLHVDEKSDVYSFGVVLLELLTGRRPVGGFGEGVDIVRWVRKTAAELPDQSDAAVAIAVADRRLTAAPLGPIVNLFKVAMRCVEEQCTARPTMREVVHMLSFADQTPVSSQGLLISS